MRDPSLSQTLLEWYDKHAREMPWRIAPSDRIGGTLPDPYRVWLSEVMLQQTTVAAVRTYFERFTHLWPTVSDLAAAPDEQVMGEWAGLGYYARARNLLKCARVVAGDLGGVFPDTREGLLELPGIGPYTASAISAIALDRPSTVVDGNVERVMARLHAVNDPMPPIKPHLAELAARYTPDTRPGCYAQAVMDLGATICTPKSPACGICPLRERCAGFAAGIQAELPRKVPKKAKPTRYGTAYVARRADGAWLLERRPERGLLGGMLGWPGSDWGDVAVATPPMDADWTAINAEVRHTFTHFHLILTVYAATVPLDAVPELGDFMPADGFRPSDLPTVMRKVFDIARAHVTADGGT